MTSPANMPTERLSDEQKAKDIASAALNAAWDEHGAEFNPLSNSISDGLWRRFEDHVARAIVASVNAASLARPAEAKAGKVEPGHSPDLLRILAEAAINVAARPPELRGPWRFDEGELQCVAAGARRYLSALEPVAEAKSVALLSVLDAYDAETSKIPLGHENASRGRSTYNWRRSVVQEIRAMLAASPTPPPAKAEPVAWRYEHQFGAGERWHTYFSETAIPEPNLYRNITPLYAAPADAREIEANLRARQRVAFRKALAQLPEIAPPEVASLLSSVHMQDEFLVEGKRLQIKHGLDAVAPRVEQECGAGAWSFMRQGVLSALASPVAQQRDEVRP